MNAVSRLLIACLCAVFASTGLVSAMFMQPQSVPTERLLKNTEAYITENPKDPQGYYIRGRIHYLTFVNRTMLAQGWERPAGKLPGLAPNWMLRRGFLEQLRNEEARKLTEAALKDGGDRSKYQGIYQGHIKRLTEERWRPEPLSMEATVEHAIKARESFDAAIKLDPKKGLYHLGVAGLLEQMMDFRAELKEKGKEIPAALAGVKQEEVVAAYHKAYQLSIPEDLNLKSKPASGIVSLVGHESGTALVKFGEVWPQAVAATEGLDLVKVKVSLEELKALPRGPITPIIVALEPERPLADMVRTGHRVRFDVDGDGKRETLASWPAASAGILVWDRDGSGEIRSGAQWFGTFGFHMIWRDGYAAMDAFDDSRDGWLSGDELRGLALWFDADGDAVSDPGEVRSLASCGVEGLAVKWTTAVDGCAANSRGVRLKGGMRAPSYDWNFEIESSVGETLAPAAK